MFLLFCLHCCSLLLLIILSDFSCYIVVIALFSAVVWIWIMFLLPCDVHDVRCLDTVLCVCWLFLFVLLLLLTFRSLFLRSAPHWPLLLLHCLFILYVVVDTLRCVFCCYCCYTCVYTLYCCLRCWFCDFWFAVFVFVPGFIAIAWSVIVLWIIVVIVDFWWFSSLRFWSCSRFPRFCFFVSDGSCILMPCCVSLLYTLPLILCFVVLPYSPCCCCFLLLLFVLVVLNSLLFLIIVLSNCCCSVSVVLWCYTMICAIIVVVCVVLFLVVAVHVFCGFWIHGYAFWICLLLRYCLLIVCIFVSRGSPFLLLFVSWCVAFFRLLNSFSAGFKFVYVRFVCCSFDFLNLLFLLHFHSRCIPFVLWCCCSITLNLAFMGATVLECSALFVLVLHCMGVAFRYVFWCRWVHRCTDFARLMFAFRCFSPFSAGWCSLRSSPMRSNWCSPGVRSRSFAGFLYVPRFVALPFIVVPFWVRSRLVWFSVAVHRCPAVFIPLRSTFRIGSPVGLVFLLSLSLFSFRFYIRFRSACTFFSLDDRFACLLL